jgi:hypothetical protein
MYSVNLDIAGLDPARRPWAAFAALRERAGWLNYLLALLVKEANL